MDHLMIDLMKNSKLLELPIIDFWLCNLFLRMLDRGPIVDSHIRMSCPSAHRPPLLPPPPARLLTQDLRLLESTLRQYCHWDQQSDQHWDQHWCRTRSRRIRIAIQLESDPHADP